jgi:C1A family cysteine protease
MSFATIMTPEHGVKGLGWRPDTPDGRDRVFNLERKVERPEALSPVFSLRSKMPPVYDQGALGSCVANGTGALFALAEKREGETGGTPSRLFVYYNGRVIEGTVREDSGLEIRDGIKSIASKGAPPETLWPYTVSKFADKPSASAYTAGQNDLALTYLRIEPGGPGSPIRTPVGTGYPVSFGFTVYDHFEAASWNPATQYLPLPKPGEGVLGGHCCDVIGWDFSLKRFPVNVFEIRNSWGSGWGDAGHFWMDARWLYEPWRNLSSDFWIIETVK